MTISEIGDKVNGTNAVVSLTKLESDLDLITLLSLIS